MERTEAGGRGERRSPGALETELLATLWAADSPLTVAQAQERLAAGGSELAYTSVLTTLTRLYAKGLVSRQLHGRAHSYSPTREAADQAARHMTSLLGAGSARADVLSRFVAGLQPDDEQVLRALLAGGPAEQPATTPPPAATAPAPVVPATVRPSAPTPAPVLGRLRRGLGRRG